MPFKKYTSIRPRPASFAAKAISFLFALSMFALSSAQAAGLGKLTVLSSLGQPLRAEIELTAVTPDEVGTIVVKLASHEAYKKANLDFSSVQQSLRFAVDKRGNRNFVRVTSTLPLNEPFLGMLLELRSINSQLTREYTFLLDPADLRSSTPAVAAAPAPAPVKAPEPAPAPVVQAEPEKPAAPAVEQEPMDDKVQRIRKQASTLKAAEKPEEKPVAAKEPEKQAAAKDKAEYKIKKGDSLAVIAKKHRHEEVTLEQMMVSIYQTNPNAFDGKNMNRLRVGRVLTVPDAETAGGVTKSEARKVVVAQAADFASYRQKLAGQVEQAAAQKQADAAQAAGGQVTAKVEDKPTPAQEAQDKLKLSKAGAKGKSGAGTAEEKAAREKAAADERARVKELQKNVSDLKRAVESQKLAEQQKKAAEAAAAKKAAEEAAAKKAAEEAAAKKAAEEAAAKKAAEEAAAKKAADEAAAKKAADDAAAAKKAADDAAAAAAKQASVPAASAPAASVPPASVPAKPAVKRAPPPPPPPPPSFFDEMLDNPLMLGGIGGVVVLLLAYVGIRMRGKKAPAPAGAAPGEGRDAPNSLFGNSGGQSVDTNNSIFNSGFIPSASLLDANEVDPIAEADVYIAYGREGQAVEILKDALRTNPERNALRVKLLEIYASQKDIKAFDMLAGELYGITRGEGDEWVHVAGLGASIDPGNPLYAGGDAVAELDRPTSLQGSMTQPQPELDPVVRLETPRAQELAEPTAQQIESPDFALDLDAPAEPKAQADSDGLDFDLGAPAAKAEEKAEAPMEEAKAEPVASLDFDLGDFGAKKEEAAPDTAGLSVSEIPASELEHMLEFKSATASQPEEDASEKAFEAQLGAIEKVEPFAPVLEEAVQPAEAAPAASAGGFDFGAINLDLQAAPALAAEAPAEQPKPAPAARSGSAEMDTKIELAAAYLGIGDKEGARELLEEVIQEGAPEQVERAREALSRIS